MNHQVTIQVECCLKRTSACSTIVIEEALRSFLQDVQSKQTLGIGTKLTDFKDNELLVQHVEFISIESITEVEDTLSTTSDTHLQLHVYQLNEDDEPDPELEDISGDETVLFQQWTLPAAALQGLWESLVYDEDIKEKLLRYVFTAMNFTRLNVDPHIVTWNRVVLLHGPPGTGKTSLCKALAHKLSIQLSKQYKIGKLIELNTHSLFSKWFSESGKLVTKAFDRIIEFTEDSDTFVCVLIDEVESLTTARKTALSGAEPSDAIRVVNAVLTQLDRIRRRPNVLVLTTSNITQAIDVAFVDRADIKQYIGLPSHEAIYNILVTCIQELIRVKLVIGEQELLKWSVIKVTNDLEDTDKSSCQLYAIAKEAQGLSGRALRRLPFIACANRYNVSTRKYSIANTYEYI
ncbi:P-loop containing nucleoside triphosphate hydrolase protein [Syncephalis plumigaleata]|nr:P-loop containing nucleoside triphosphate hydrolase protein [Syncephalis plumigaleata]